MPEGWIERAQPLLGTLVTIGVRGTDDARAHFALDAAFAAVADVHRLMSFHEPASEVSRLNRDAARGAVRVDARTFEVLHLALGIAAATDGAFDISLAPQLVAQGLLPAPDGAAAPDPRASWRDIELIAPDAVAFHRALWIDLGGIAKGYAVDLAREALFGCGVERAIVSAGESSIAAFERPGDPRWSVGVRHPGSDTSIVGTLRISNTALSTSGSSARGFAIGGVRYAHVLDPRTGTPMTGERSATAVCASAALAEVASKILLLEGCERGIDIADANGWDVEGAAFVGDRSEAGVWIKRSGGLDLDVWRSCA